MNPEKSAKVAEFQLDRYNARMTTKTKTSKKKAAKPKKLSEGRGDYEAHLERARAIHAQESFAGRDIAPIPPIENLERRASTRFSLEAFARTYNPEPLKFSLSTDHLTMIQRMEEAVLHGALYAIAMPRGSGKSYWTRMAILWAIIHAHRFYAFGIGATKENWIGSLTAIKTLLRNMRSLKADFPEVCRPFAHINGIAVKAIGQHCDGVPTMAKWDQDNIILATVPAPPNWSKDWPLRSDGMAPTSGSMIAGNGLTSEGIRGANITLTSGDVLRPDIFFPDDPQTPESAGSEKQNTDRERIINRDLLGLAAPGTEIAGVMPCTVIKPGDMIDRTLDRKLYPHWRGERYKMFRTMPTNMDAWARYFEVYHKCLFKSPPDQTEANEHYIEDKTALEAGADLSWADRKSSRDVSAIQHAMHLYDKFKHAGFMAEFQNDPVPEGAGDYVEEVNKDVLVKKVNNIRRGLIPRECNLITCGTDVGDHVLWYVICAWDNQFGGSVIDYGTWPPQGASYFRGGDPPKPLGMYYGGLTAPEAIYRGLDELMNDLIPRQRFQHETDNVMYLERTLIDSGDNTDTVYKFVRQSIHRPSIYASKGFGLGPQKPAVSEWAIRDGEKPGYNWRLSAPDKKRGRIVAVDTNLWKSFLRDRLVTPMGGRGCLSLFGAPNAHDQNYTNHDFFADHITAEKPERITHPGRGRTMEVWEKRPARENHWLDCLVLAAVAASVQGLEWTPTGEITKKAEKRRRNIEELYELAQQRQGVIA